MHANACYRHPERESYISCQRCERRVCPDCQTPAAVGVVCPECLAAQRKAAPRVMQAARREQPLVTYWLIGITVATFGLQLLPGLGLTSQFAYAGIYSSPLQFEPWRMVTTMFVHSTSFIMHILLNMYTLWIFGQVLERLLGGWRFVTLYLLAGIGGSVGVLWLQAPLVPVVGASGAIFGLLGAFLVIQRSLGGQTRQLMVLLLINLVIGFIPGFSISWQAHLGGLLTGAAIGAVFAATRRPEARGRQLAGLVAIAATLLVLSLRYFVFSPVLF